jgi:hypothetical protein
VPHEDARSQGAIGYRKGTHTVEISYRGRWARTGRFFDILNMPIAALGVFFVVVVVNLFLYFGYYSPRTPTSPAAEQTTPSRTIAMPERTGPEEGTLPEVTRTEGTTPKTTLQSTVTTDQSATASATSSP